MILSARPSAGPPAKASSRSSAAGIEADREQAGEPADRAREIDVVEDLLAAMSLEIEQDGIAVPRP